MRIAIVAVEGSLLSAITGLVDLFWMTNQALQSPQVGALSGVHDLPKVSFETCIVSFDGKPLRDTQGRPIPVDASYQEVTKCQAVLIAGMALGSDGLPPDSESITQAAHWLRGCHQQGMLVGAACAGTFVLGQSGLLNGRRCATTWWLHHAFKRRFPQAQLVWGSAVEEQNHIITTGGPLSWIDLGLQVMRALAGKDIAKLAADIAVTDSQPLPQLMYAPPGFVSSADPLLLKAEHIIRHVAPSLTAGGLAKALNLSERTLHRRLKSLCNESPKEFITRVRMETACTLLNMPKVSIKEIATKCGYGEETSFRRAFTQMTGRTPLEYKRWANTRNVMNEID